MKSQKIKFVTGPVLFGYVHLDPKELPLIEGASYKYCMSVVIKKSNLEEIERINKTVETLKKGLPIKAKGGLKEGEDPDCLYLNVVSAEKPGMVDLDLNPILDAGEIYSGCTGRVSVTAYTYHLSKQTGVAFGLNNIQKLGDGPDYFNAFSSYKFNRL